MNQQVPQWLAVHLYVDEPWETLLGQGVQPLVQAVLTAGESEQFCFCRSWNEQPHVRLYFQGRSGQIHPALQPRLERYFRHDFAHRLLSTSDADRFTYHVDFLTVAVPAMLKAGTDTSAPVSARYAGLLSQVTLGLFAQTMPWSAAHGLTAAIQLHVGFAWMLGLDWAATGAFYRAASAQWRCDDARSADDRQKGCHFTGHLRAQQHKLYSYSRALWTALQLAAPFEEQWFRQWLHALQLLRQEVQTSFPSSTCDPQQWSSLAAYSHLINNQLGIVAQEEMLLGQLLADTLAVPLSLSTQP